MQSPCERQIFHSTLPVVKVEFFDKAIKTRIKISINIKLRGSFFISQGHIVQVSQTWRQRQEAMIRLSSDKNDVENTTEKIKRKTFLVNLKQYCVQKSQLRLMKGSSNQGWHPMNNILHFLEHSSFRFNIIAFNKSSNVTFPLCVCQP